MQLVINLCMLYLYIYISLIEVSIFLNSIMFFFNSLSILTITIHKKILSIYIMLKASTNLYYSDWSSRLLFYSYYYHKMKKIRNIILFLYTNNIVITMYNIHSIFQFVDNVFFSCSSSP